jgi:thiol-disulfide isomerase/thioredoxin
VSLGQPSWRPRGGAGRGLSLLRVAVLGAVVTLAMLGAPPCAPAAASGEALEALLVQSYVELVPAPAVTLRDLDGRPLTLRDLRGQVVFVNFWATWCVPCRNEMPALENLYRAYRDRGFVVVGVNFRESAGVVRGFMQELRLSFPALVDTDAAMSRAFGVRGLPVSFLLDREGRILWKAIGSREWDSSHGRTYLDDALRLQPR